MLVLVPCSREAAASGDCSGKSAAERTTVNPRSAYQQPGCGTYEHGQDQDVRGRA
jgi:hypothetical protein